MAAAVDTAILIWGVRQEVDPERPDLVPRCKKLVDYLAKQSNNQIILPSAALSEYLTGFNGEKQAQQIEIISRNFVVAPLDAKAAAIAAELYDRPITDEMRRQYEIGKQCIKTDLFILATAIAHQASEVFADDFQMLRTLARGKIIVNQIPSLAELEAAESPSPAARRVETPRSLPGME